MQVHGIEAVQTGILMSLTFSFKYDGVTNSSRCPVKFMHDIHADDDHGMLCDDHKALSLPLYDHTTFKSFHRSSTNPLIILHRSPHYISFNNSNPSESLCFMFFHHKSIKIHSISFPFTLSISINETIF